MCQSFRVACWLPRELAADEVLTPYGQLRPLTDRRGRGLAELVHLVDPVTGAGAKAWRRAVVRVPCGECPGCAVDWTREWTVRSLAEFLEGHRGYPEHRERDAWFGTFTFDDAHVPRVDVDGRSVMTLDREVWTGFEKRLREWMRWWYPEARLRRLTVGEYGSLRLRPHFHALLFDLPLEDARVEVAKSERREFPLFVSPSLTKLWGHGAVWLGRVSRESCGYVTSYMAKAARWPYGAAEPMRFISSGCGRSAAGGALGGFGSAYFDRYWESVYSPAAGEHRGMMICGAPGDLKWLPTPRYFNRRLREAHFEAWLDFERARLAKAKELREVVTLNNRQAKVVLLWDRVTRKTRDGLFPTPGGPVLPVQYSDGRVEAVRVVHRYDEVVTVGAYGTEAGFGLGDYLDEMAHVAARDAREVPFSSGVDGSVMDSEGNPARFDFMGGDVRRDLGGFRIGTVVGLDDLVVPGSDGDGGSRAPALPGDVVREAGFPEVRRQNG